MARLMPMEEFHVFYLVWRLPTRRSSRHTFTFTQKAPVASLRFIALWAGTLLTIPLFIIVSLVTMMRRTSRLELVI